MSLSNFNALVRTVNALRRMEFDPAYFQVSGGGDAPPIISLRIPNMDDLPWEWRIQHQQDKLIVTPADVVWGTTLCECAKTDGVPDDVVLDMHGLAVGESRWVYAEIDFNAKTATAKLTDTDAKAVNDPLAQISRRNLSRYTLDFAYTLRRTAICWVGGIEIGAEYGNP